MIHSSRQLKDLVRNMSEKTGVEAHVLIRKYMMERFLERMSLSKYRDNFVLKGGLLVSAFVGTQVRTTMDIDTTIHGLSISEKSMTQIIEEICAIPLDDNVRFEVKNVSTIMDGAEYGGIRFSMEAFLDNSVTPLKIDISTGDIITPCEILYSYKLMFEDQDIAIMVYPIETVLAEKIETVIARSTTNTRMRDFYDIHVLLNSPKQVINQAVLSRALTATSGKRGSIRLMENAENVLSALQKSTFVQALWERYQKKNTYAKNYSWEEIMMSAREVCLEAGLPVEKPSTQVKLNQSREAGDENMECCHKKKKRERER